MIQHLSILHSPDTDPYRNLALEELLLQTVQEGECILYLWQNRHTVVIGRNQNCWKECRVSALESDGGFLARRLSGGGAVYHDLGNLNFTFLLHAGDYDVARQLRVLLEAVHAYGIDARQTGRNDITVDGRKISGNAFYRCGSTCYHHGTILLDVDMAAMSRYLQVDRSKLQAKGVRSVRSRVANLTQFNPDITVAGMKAAMEQAFSAVYGLPVRPMESGRIDRERLETLSARYASGAWKYSVRGRFDYSLSARYPWGGLQLDIRAGDGRLQEVHAYSDALEPDWIDAIAPVLTGCPVRADAMEAAADALPQSNLTQEQMKQDLLHLLRDAF